MKKSIKIIFFSFLLSLIYIFTANASEYSNVIDISAILTDDEWYELEDKAESIQSEYDIGVYVITLPDFHEFTDADNIDDASIEIYEALDLGVGDDGSVIFLVLSMAERDYCLRAYGFGNVAFTDYGKDYISEKFLKEFKDDNWYEGFNVFLDTADEMLALAKQGNPVDIYNSPDQEAPIYYGIIIAFIISLIIAFIVNAVLKAQLKSVSEKTEAQFFIKDGIHLTVKSDLYKNTTVSRVYSPKESKSSSSGGTTIDSSGGSSKSGKF